FLRARLADLRERNETESCKRGQEIRAFTIARIELRMHRSHVAGLSRDELALPTTEIAHIADFDQVIALSSRLIDQLCTCPRIVDAEDCGQIVTRPAIAAVRSEIADH